MHPFETMWNTFYPGLFPAGHMLREMAVPNWLRFHSLPLSKRYADTDAERKILLARHNELAEEVLGTGNACWLAQTSLESQNGANTIGGGFHRYDLSRAFSFSIDDGSGAEQEWNVDACHTSWISGKFDELLWAIANERSVSTLWMSAATGSVFAPYDGGIDLFLPSQDAVRDLKAKHLNWLSPRADGL